MQKLIKVFFGWVLVISACVGCQPTKKVHQERLYLQGIDTTLDPVLTFPETIIQKSDVLSITVYSDNPEATALYNRTPSATGSSVSGGKTDLSAIDPGAASNAGSGYLVDLEGNIWFYSLGKLHVEGLTKLQLIQLLRDKLAQYLKNPYVEIRFLNKRVTILGEVSRPGTINLPEERLSVLDAIALSGEMTVFGRKDNILVVREENGKRTSSRLNVRDPAIYRSDYFYLHQNDLVYIEPMRKKPSGTDAQLMRNIALAATLTSTVAILITLFR